TPRHPSLLPPTSAAPRDLHSFPTRRSSDLATFTHAISNTKPTATNSSSRNGSTDPSNHFRNGITAAPMLLSASGYAAAKFCVTRSEEHTSELQSRFDLVCRLLLEKKKKKHI